MVKKAFLVGVILLLVSLVVGCGIPQEQYDAVFAERDQAQQELQSVKAELEAAQAKVSELTSSLGKTKSELEAGQSELETAQSELGTVNSELKVAQSDLEAVQTEYETFKADVKSSCDRVDKYLAVNHYVLGINCGLCLDDLNKIEGEATSTTARVANVEDAELKSLWEAAYVVQGGRWELKYVPFERFMSRLRGQINRATKTVRDKLAE